MGHAHHFLSRLDRVSLQQVELSLGLYNDAPLLRYILSRSGLPKGAERVAISLDDTSEGPFLIVTREGHFVTCLAKGMHHDLPVVRRWQLDLLSERHEALRAAMRPVEQVPESDRAFYRIFKPVFEAGPNLSREQFLDLSPWQPMMFKIYQSWIAETYRWLTQAYFAQRHVDRPLSRDLDRLEAYWKQLWAIRHMLLLLGVGEPVEYFEGHPRESLEKITESDGSVASDECAFPLGLAGAWCTARFGGAYMPICGHKFERAEREDRVHQAALELSAIAGAHPRHRDVILGAFRGAAERAANDAPQVEHHEDRVKAARKVVRAFERGDDLDVRAARYGAELLFARKHPAIEAHGWRSPLDVPLDVARPYATMPMHGWVWREETADLLYDLAPSVARFKPEDFYLPARWLRSLRVQWTPEDTLAHLRMQRGHFEPRKPVKAEKEPGRNDPCTCGSGAKYKRCCALAPKLPKAPEAPAERVPSLADGIMPRPRVEAPHPSLFPPPEVAREAEEARRVDAEVEAALADDAEHAA